MDEECTDKNCHFYDEDYVANCTACTKVSDEPLFAQGCEMSKQPPTPEPSEQEWISVKDRIQK